ncbi:hypothetical protein EB118_12160 [bacterium]|nr:hypothetical protein [bacterium]
MDGVLKRKFRVSIPEDECVIKLQEYCEFSSTLLKIPVVSKPLCADANCHNNVNHYVETYGGEKISGYYLITDVDNDTYGCAIYHSIWKNTYGDLVDITPFEDGREYNMFSVLDAADYLSGVLYDGYEYVILNIGMNVL